MVEQEKKAQESTGIPRDFQKELSFLSHRGYSLSSDHEPLMYVSRNLLSARFYNQSYEI